MPTFQSYNFSTDIGFNIYFLLYDYFLACFTNTPISATEVAGCALISAFGVKRK